MICMGMLTACGGNKTEVVPIGDTEEADREVPYAMYINRVEEKIQKIWEERGNKQKVYQSVCLFGGLLLIIVLL